MSRYIRLSYVMVRYVVVRYVRCVMSCYGTLSFDTLCHVMVYYFTLMLCHVMVRYVTSYHVMVCYVMIRYAVV